MGGQTAAQSVLEPIGVANRIRVYSTRPRWRAFLQIRNVIDRVKPSIAIILGQAAAPPLATFRLAAILRLLGVPDVRIANLVPPAGETWPGEGERLCSGLRAVGVDGATPPFAIPHFAQAREVVHRRFIAAGMSIEDPYLVFCGGGKALTQRWSLDRYAKVLLRIHEAWGFPVVVIGSALEMAEYRAEFGIARFGVRYFDSLDLIQLFELLRGAFAYLGNDTGPMHAAAAVACPVIAVMSARNAPGQWYPEVEPRLIFRRDVPCQHCLLNECITEGHRCMTDIGIEEVTMGALRFLDGLVDRLVESTGDRRL